jgi:nicotinamidase-related amidase
MKLANWTLVVGFVLAVSLGASTVRSASVIDNWGSVKAPPAPELKPVNVDPKTTALLMLDYVKQICNAERYPRCPQRLPTVKKLLDQARANGVMVVYTGTTIPNSERADIDPSVAPTGNEPFVKSVLDKFLNTDLEKILKDKGITTVIAVGQAAQGAVITTGSEAAQRGFKVIVAVDGIAAQDDYYEQYTVWHLGNAPLLSTRVTLTSTDLIKF